MLMMLAGERVADSLSGKILTIWDDFGKKVLYNHILPMFRTSPATSQ